MKLPGELYGGWYIVAVIEGRIYTLIYGPFGDADEAVKHEKAAEAGFRSLTDKPVYTVDFDVMFCLTGTLIYGRANNRLWGAVINPSPITDLEPGVNAKYLVRTPPAPPPPWGENAKGW